MRIIKFRIYCDLYDDKSKHMFYDGIGFDDDGWYIENGGYYLDDLREPDDDEHPETACICEVMQFTGLYDRKGVEIYEGDILKNSKYDNAYKVYYDENMAFYKCDQVNGSDTGLVLYHIHYSYEVIGNIYSNPELLNNE